MDVDAPPNAAAAPVAAWAWRFDGDVRDPGTGGTLRDEQCHYPGGAGDAVLSADGREWPMIDHCPYLRVTRDDLRDRAVRLLKARDSAGAEALLLTDRDDFAPDDPLSPEQVGPKIDVAPTFRATMAALGYGPVGHYFAHRSAVPTFLSGLALLALAPPPRSGEPAAGVLELCCGAGHFLRHLGGRRGPVVGVDIVFSKLWLLDLFIVADDSARLLCCDASAAPVPLPDGAGRTVFCHDALYFLPDKRHVLREMKRLAGPGGCVLVGHAHNSAADHGDVAGTPLTPAEYLALFGAAGMPGPDLYDDAELAESCLSHARPQARSADELENCEAIAAVWPGGGDHWDPALTLPAPGTPLSVNPLLVEADGVLEPDWPMPRFAEEYRSATYLTHLIRPDERAVIDAAKAAPVPFDAADIVTERLARRRVLLDVPGGLVMGGALNWAVVGCGWVARDHGGPGLSAAPNCELVAAYDPDPGALDRFLSRFPRARGFGSLAELLADPAVRSVYLATPNHAHRGPALTCAAAGAPVLCEKPLAHNRKDAAAVVRAFAGVGVPLAAAFDQRFHPAHVLLRDMIAAGELGAVTHAMVHYACWLPADWSPDGAAHDNWRADRRRAGGGAAVDLAPHGLDLLETLLDARWESLHALTHAAVHDYDVDDGAVLAGRLTDGNYCGETLATLHVGYDTPDALPRRRLELVGTRASAVLTDTMGQTPGGTFVLHDAATGAARDVPFETTADPFAAQAEAFADCILSGEPFPFPPAEDLRRHELLLNALESSHRTGG